MSKVIDWDKLKIVWESNLKVVAVWVFGSAQEGLVKPGSDVDIAILFESQPSLEDQLDLLTQLQKRLQVEDIDLVVLNEANPILCFEAVSGRLLFCRDANRRAEFVSLVAREYEDAMALWQRGLEYRQEMTNKVSDNL